MSTALDDAREGLEYAADALLKPLASMSAEANKTDCALAEALQHVYAAMALVDFRNATWRVAGNIGAAETPAPKESIRRQLDGMEASGGLTPLGSADLERQVYAAVPEAKAQVAAAKPPETVKPPEPMKVQRFAVELGVSESQVYRWIECGDIRPEMHGKVKMIPPATVRLFFALRDTMPKGRTSVAAWINKRIHAKGRGTIPLQNRNQ